MGTIVMVACGCGFTNTLCIGSGMADKEIRLSGYTPKKFKYHFDYHRTSASFNNRAGIAGVSMQSFNNCVTMPSKSYLRLNL